MDGRARITLQVSDNPAELHVLRARLETEGIETVIENEAMAPLLGGVPADTAHLPALCLVRAGDEEKARRVLEEFARANGTRLVGPGEVRCPLCGSADTVVDAALWLPVSVLVLGGLSVAASLFFAILYPDPDLVLATLVWAAVLGSVTAAAGIWVRHEVRSVKKRYLCGDCGMRWRAAPAPAPPPGVDPKPSNPGGPS